MKNANKKIVLHAGNYFFGRAGTHVHTLLGSCVSITLWHPQLRIGGMCHFALPRTDGVDNSHLNPRYAEDCIQLFKLSAQRKNTKLSEYLVKIFGGSNMFFNCKDQITNAEEQSNIGARNVKRAYQLLLAEDVNIVLTHVGEFGYRRIVFDLNTGDVWVRFSDCRKVSSARIKTQQGRF